MYERCDIYIISRLAENMNESMTNEIICFLTFVGHCGSKAFQGIYEKATILVPKTKLESYTSLLKARGVSAKAVIKASK